MTYEGGQPASWPPHYLNYPQRRKERRVLQSTRDTDDSRFPRGECGISGTESSQGIPAEIPEYPQEISCWYYNAPLLANYVSLQEKL